MAKITKPRNKTQGRRWLAALRFVKRQFDNTHYYQGAMLNKVAGKELRCELGQLSGYFGVDGEEFSYGLQNEVVRPPLYPSDIMGRAKMSGGRPLTLDERDYVELVQFITGNKTPHSHGSIVRRNDAGKASAVKANDEYLARVEKVVAEERAEQ